AGEVCAKHGEQHKLRYTKQYIAPERQMGPQKPDRGGIENGGDSRHAYAEDEHRLAADSPGQRPEVMDKMGHRDHKKETEAARAYGRGDESRHHQGYSLMRTARQFAT